jgi:hypothetical protein
MTAGQFNSVAILILLLSFFSGTIIAKRGGKGLTDSQRAELTALGPDVPGIGGLICAVALGYLAPQLHRWSIVGAVVCGTVSFVRVPLRLYRQPWPQMSRVLLLLGNTVLVGGAVLYAAVRAIPYVLP